MATRHVLRHVIRRTLTSSTATFTTTTKTTVQHFSLLRTLSAVRLPPSQPIWRSFSTEKGGTNASESKNDEDEDDEPEVPVELPGCDFEHFLIIVDPPPQDWTRDQIIDSYVKTLAEVVGSEEEARMKLYSVSTKHYFAFGARISQEVADKLEDNGSIQWVIPDSYFDARNEDYGGEPVIDGVAVPYDPKYHVEWVANNKQEQQTNNSSDNRPPRVNTRGPPNQQMGPPNRAPQAQNKPPRNAGNQQNDRPRITVYQPKTPPNDQESTQNTPPADITGGNEAIEQMKEEKNAE